MSEFVDRTLTCVDCRRPFKFSAAIRAAREETRGQRIQTEVVCAECGAQTTVPFVPSEGRPVYCKPCFDKRSQ